MVCIHAFLDVHWDDYGTGDGAGSWFCTYVFVLDVSPRFAFQLGQVLGLCGEMLDEHFLYPEVRFWFGSWTAALTCSPRDLTVANVMTNAALLEHTVMSGSTAMIFFTLVTILLISRLLDRI